MSTHLRDEMVAQVLARDAKAFKAHYHATAEAFFDRLRVGARFSPEQWHRSLLLTPRVPQSLSANSSAVINGWLRAGRIELIGVGLSSHNANHATRMRVYQKLKV